MKVASSNVNAMEIERSRREVAMDTALPYEKKTTEPSHGLMRVINNQSCLRNRMYARGCYALTALVTAFLFYQIASGEYYSLVEHLADDADLLLELVVIHIDKT